MSQPDFRDDRIHEWVRSGAPAQAPSDLVMRSLARTRAMPRGRAFPAWWPARFATPTLALGAVGAVAILISGALVVTDSRNRAGGPPPPSQSQPVESATDRPTASTGTSAAMPIFDRYSGMWLDAGQWEYRPFDPRFSFEVPHGSRIWKEPGDLDVAPFSGLSNDAPAGLDVVRVVDPWVDPCDTTQGRLGSKAPPTAESIAGWLAASPHLTVGRPEAVVLGGSDVTRIDVVAGAGCANATHVGGLPAVPPLERALAFARGNAHRIYLFTVAGEPIAVDVHARSTADLDRWAVVTDELLATMTFVEGNE